MDKQREIDVEALRPDLLGLVSIRFVVECKATTKPWVLLSSPDTVSDYGRHFAFAESAATARELFIKRFENFERLAAKLPWIDKDGLIGYSLRQAHSDKDSGYEVAIGLAKACRARIREREQRVKRIAFVFPVIVTSAPLIQCSLADDGQLQLEEVKQGEFLFLGGGLHACIRVVTANHLPAFVIEAKNIADALHEEFKADGERILKES